MEGRRAGCSCEAAREAREAEAREISSAVEDMVEGKEIRSPV